MSEHRGSYIGVIIFAIVLGAVSVLLWLGGEVNTVEKVLIVASVFFCLFLLIKQRWALIGICCTLLVAIVVYFAQAWLLPIATAEPGLIMPNILKMIVGILFLIFIGRQSIEHRFAR
jgi:predicted neutral ceramidase superfamily lipid hydrolase